MCSAPIRTLGDLCSSLRLKVAEAKRWHDKPAQIKDVLKAHGLRLAD